MRLLTEHFYIIAPDLPGQSVRGLKSICLLTTILSSWLFEVLNHLHLNEFNLLGVSWGGFVALQTTAATSQRIQHSDFHSPTH
jgi:pimeloyl-ACP methyl ester carboxylesterase